MKKHLSQSLPNPTSTNTVPQIPNPFSEPIQFPSSLTVTTTMKSTDKLHDIVSDTNENDMKKSQHKNSKKTTNPSSSKESQLPNIFNSFSLSKEVTVECKNSKEDKHRSKDTYEKASDKPSSESDRYLNSMGSFTITPVPINIDSKQSTKTSSIVNNVIDNKQKDLPIRVKSQATLIKEADELAKKDKDKTKSKHLDKSHTKPPEKRTHSPLHIETNFPKDKIKLNDIQKVSPNYIKNNKLDDLVPKKHIDNLRVVENNIPRPGLVPVHHSPTFAKPDKPAPDIKKPKKDIVIVSDLDPLADNPVDQLSVDDSSSDVEVIGEEIGSSTIDPKTDGKSSSKPSSVVKSDSRQVPSVPLNREKQLNNIKRNDISHHNSQIRHSSKDKHLLNDSIISVPSHQSKVSENRSNHTDKMDIDDTEADIHKVMQNLREMQVHYILIKHIIEISIGSF